MKEQINVIVVVVIVVMRMCVHEVCSEEYQLNRQWNGVNDIVGVVYKG